MKGKKNPTRNKTGGALLFRSGNISCVFAEREKREMINTGSQYESEILTRKQL